MQQPNRHQRPGQVQLATDRAEDIPLDDETSTR